MLAYKEFPELLAKYNEENAGLVPTMVAIIENLPKGYDGKELMKIFKDKWKFIPIKPKDYRHMRTWAVSCAALPTETRVTTNLGKLYVREADETELAQLGPRRGDAGKAWKAAKDKKRGGAEQQGSKKAAKSEEAAI